MLAVRTSSSGQQQKFQAENKINREVKEVKKENKKESKEVVQQKQHRKNADKRFVSSKFIRFFFKLFKCSF